MDLAIALLLSAAAGFCAKFSDEVADRKIPLAEAYAAALLWGLLAGFMTVGGDLSSLYIAMAAGTILSGKFDHALHFASLIMFGAVLLAFPLSSFDPWLFSLFLIAAVVDEIELKNSFIRMFAERRMWLPAAAAIAWIWSGQGIYFFAIVSFDIAYKAAEFLCNSLFLPHQHAMHVAAMMRAGNANANSSHKKTKHARARR